MAGIVNEESLGRSIEGISSGLRSQSGETLAEWRSSEQLENGTPSTSPPYWDSDDDDGGGGPKPSELYGKYTWKIEKFSQLNKRELRSNAFEVGGYKWYILIYPQGCDVCNHLSLFLCVANHDKLLPGWSHFAQFTIAVVNKDPKKSKFSDTLHRFWKKEHDWGWKKFMELSKVLDGFIDADTLIIKAQVQVIRERADRPFRCLDCQYRRELVRVYLTNVEQICRRFVEERRSKLGKLIEDKNRWSSFCAFWLGIDQSSRRRMSREKTDAILKVVVKHFFIEKEVTSTLVMDSLYSGLKALEGQAKMKKVGGKLLEAEEMPAPIVRIEKDMFVLVDDVLLLLERAAFEPLPPKDEKGPQNRTKEGGLGEDFNKDSIERDERRLTELGRRTVEIFVLAHIYSNKVEVAYQEAVALERQEELIREEEAAWLAESEQKAKRGATEKEKKAKKKQAKQKRNNRKGREKGREERIIQDMHEKEAPGDDKDSVMKEMQSVLEKPDRLEDVSDVSDSVDTVGEALHHDSEDRDASHANWDIDTSEVHPPVEASCSLVSSLSSAQTGSSDKKGSSVIDDSSSTCSTDSVPSVVMNGSYKASSFSNYKNQKTPSRRKNQQDNATYDRNKWGNETDSQTSGPAPDTGDQSDMSESSKPGESESEAAVGSFTRLDQLRRLVHEMAKKEKGMVAVQRKPSPKKQVDTERALKDKTSVVPSSSQSTQLNLPTAFEQKPDNRSSSYLQKTSSNGSQAKAAPVVTSPHLACASKNEVQKTPTPKITEKAVAQQVTMMSRPSSAPLIPALRHLAPVVSVAQTTQLLSRSASAAGRLGPDSLPTTLSYAPPQSYRNAMMGNHIAASTTSFTQPGSSTSGINPSPVYSQATALVSAPMFSSQNSDRLDSNPIKSSIPLGTVSRDLFPNGMQWMDGSQMNCGRSVHFNTSLNEGQNLDFYSQLHGGIREPLSADFSACTSGRHVQGLTEEFPHLDIINDLLDEEHCVGKAARTSSIFPPLSNGPTFLNRQFSLPGDVSGDVGSSTSSCRFERTHSYHDAAFRRGFRSSVGHIEPGIDYMAQGTTLPYVNGQVEGMISNHWQINSDPSLLGSISSEYEAYPYFNPEFSNMACGINGYNIFRPSNGH